MSETKKKKKKMLDIGRKRKPVSKSDKSKGKSKGKSRKKNTNKDQDDKEDNEQIKMFFRELRNYINDIDDNELDEFLKNYIKNSSSSNIRTLFQKIRNLHPELIRDFIEKSLTLEQHRKVYDYDRKKIVIDANIYIFDYIDEYLEKDEIIERTNFLDEIQRKNEENEELKQIFQTLKNINNSKLGKHLQNYFRNRNISHNNKILILKIKKLPPQKIKDIIKKSLKLENQYISNYIDEYLDNKTLEGDESEEGGDESEEGGDESEEGGDESEEDKIDLKLKKQIIFLDENGNEIEISNDKQEKTEFRREYKCLMEYKMVSWIDNLQSYKLKTYIHSIDENFLRSNCNLNKEFEYNGEKFFLANNRFFKLQCEIDNSKKMQNGDIFSMNIDGNIVNMKILYISQSLTSEPLMQNEEIFQKQIIFFKKKKESDIVAIERILDGDITEDIKLYLFEEFKREILKIESEFDIKFSINNVFDKILTKSNNVRDLVFNIEQIIVYLAPLNNYFENLDFDKRQSIFSKRLVSGYYHDNIIPDLSQEEKFPEIFENNFDENIKQRFRDYFDKVIHTNMFDLISKYYYITNKGKQYNQTYKHTNVNMLGNVKYKDLKLNCINKEDIEQIPYQDIIIYHSSTLKNNYCFSLKELVKNFAEGNYKFLDTEENFNEKFVIKILNMYINKSTSEEKEEEKDFDIFSLMLQDVCDLEKKYNMYENGICDNVSIKSFDSDRTLLDNVYSGDEQKDQLDIEQEQKDQLEIEQKLGKLEELEELGKLEELEMKKYDTESSDDTESEDTDSEDDIEYNIKHIKNPEKCFGRGCDKNGQDCIKTCVLLDENNTVCAKFCTFKCFEEFEFNIPKNI